MTFRIKKEKKWILNKKTKGKSNKKGSEGLSKKSVVSQHPPPLKYSAMQGQSNEQIKFHTKFTETWDWEVSIEFSSKEVNGDFIYNSLS